MPRACGSLRANRVTTAADRGDDIEEDELPELDRLISDQRADDTPRQRPEEHGGDHGAPVLSIEALGLTQLSADLDGVTVSGQGLGGDYDEADGPALAGRHKQQRLGSVWQNREPESDAERIVRKAIAGLSDEEQETFRLVYGEKKSLREAGELLGISYETVRRRCDALKGIVTRALVQAAGGEVDE